MAGFLLAICHYFFECYKVEYRLILSDRHHDKPSIRAAVGAVAGDERQNVVVAGYGCANWKTRSSERRAGKENLVGNQFITEFLERRQVCCSCHP